MQPTDWLHALTREGQALARAADGDLSVMVPSCPRWTLADLVVHTGEVLAFWAAVVRDEIDEPETIEPSPRPADADVPSWFRARLAEAERVLRTSDPAARCWTWSEQHDVAFVIRRLAQELAVHHWDAETAVGGPARLEPELASDGIDEFLTHFLGWRHPDAEPLGGSVHLHCTDVAGEWMVRPEETGPVVTREHAKGSCALRGTAEDLLLVLWRRRPLDVLEVIGDAAVGRRFLAWTNLG